MSRRGPIDVVTGLRNTRRSMGDGTVQGRVRNATPYRRGSAKRIPASKVVAPASTRADGRFIRFEFGSWATGEWTVTESAGWPHETVEQVETIPASGYYDLHQTFDREGLDKADVTLTVLVNDEPKIVRDFYAAPSTVHTVLPLGVLSEGDHVQTFYEVSGGGLMNFNSGQSVMQLVDRQVGEVNDAAPQTLIQELGSVNEFSHGAVSVGWAFDVGPSAVTVVGLRVYMPIAVTRTLYLWGNNESDPLGTVEVTTVPGQWVSGPITPVTLDPGSIGTLSVPLESEGVYNSARLSTGTVVTHPNVTYRNGRFSNSNLHPQSVSTTDDALLGVVDAIVIGDGGGGG